MNRWVLSIIAMTAFCSSTSTAQEQATPHAAQDDLQDQTGPSVEKLEATISRQRKRIEALEQQDAKRAKEHQALEQAVQQLKQDKQDAEQQILQESSELEFKPGIEIYGFFDLSFMKSYFDKTSILNQMVNRSSSFVLTTANMYVTSQMTRQLGALMEVAFTYLPIGQPTGFEVFFKNGNTETQVPGLEFGRTNTSITDPKNSGTMALGGIYLERIHLSYTPRDWLNIIAGRFLTPYGIWNVDHGSPVVIPATLPYMQIRHMVPLAQTGLELFGRLFPLPNMLADYALTLSNGRGPMDEIYDLDENKGLGVRGRLIYEGNTWKAAVGTYLYYGRYSDEKVDLVIDIAQGEMSTRVESTIDYDEYIASADLLLQMYGFRLQSEYVYRRVAFNKPMKASVLFPLFGATGLPLMELPIPGADPGIQPDFFSQDVYVLASYRLPLDRWFGPVQVMPYVLIEFNQMDDQQEGDLLYIWGLNIRPSHVLVFKGQGSHFNSDLTGAFSSFQLQMAVSF